MAGLLTHRAELVKSLRQVLPGRIHIEAHGGKFDLAELKRYSTRAPAVLIAILRAGDAGTTQPRAEVRCAAYLVIKDTRDEVRDAAHLLLADRLMQLLRRTPLPDAGKASQLTWDNLYSGYADEEGIALGAVSWRQPLVLDQDLAPQALADFNTLFATDDALPPDGDASRGQTVTLNP